MDPQRENIPPKLPGKGLLGWIGRQIGYVSRAVKADVTTEPKTVLRDTKIAEQPHPENPNVKLRRTIIDEVVVKPPPKKQED